MPPQDDIHQKREALKKKLLGAFNSVAPKTMKVRDLANNFETADDKYFRWYQKPTELLAEHMMSNRLKQDIPAERGVYVGVENGRPETYVSSEYLRRHLINGIDSGRADDHLEDAEKIGLAAVDAVRETPDQSARVRTGEIKPKPQPKPGKKP